MPTVFTKNRDRLLEADVARKFLAELMDHNELRGLLSDEHFSVDGTQTAAWASMKSFYTANLLPACHPRTPSGRSCCSARATMTAGAWPHRSYRAR